MYQLAWHNSFTRSFKKVTKNNNELKESIIGTLRIMQKDPYNPVLRTHKLHGKLKEFWAVIVEYDCRIVFAFTKHPDTREEIIALVDIGTHDDVY